MGAPKLSPKEILRERWLRGRLGYKLHEGQRKIDEAVAASKHQLFVGEIARQFGKSYWLVIKVLEKAIKTPKGRIKYGTAFQTDLLEFILPTFDMVMDDCPEDLRPQWKSQQSKFVFSNGAEIKLVGLDRKPNGLRGNKIDLIVLDEAGFMSRLNYLYRSVIIPATTHRPDCRILVFSTPPETPAHEFLDYVQKAEIEGGYLKFTIYDNPLVNPATIKRLMLETGCTENPDGSWNLSTTWRREYLCEHITDANLQIIPEWNDSFVEERTRDHFFQFYHLYVAMDLGVADFTAVLFGYYDFRRAQLVIEDEIVMNGPTLTTLVIEKAIKEKEAELWGERKPYYRVSDNNNPLLLQDLSSTHSLHFTPTDKGRLEEMVNTVKIMVRSGGIIVHPRCKQLKGCLKYGVWDKNRTKFAESIVYGHFDALAALIYLVRNLNRATNPIPHDYLFDPSNQILWTPKDSADVMTLKDAFGLRGRR